MLLEPSARLIIRAYDAIYFVWQGHRVSSSFAECGSSRLVPRALIQQVSSKNQIVSSIMRPDGCERHLL